MDIDAEKQVIQSHIDRGNYHAAINLALSAMNACRREENQQGVDLFIGVIRGIVDTVDDAFGSEHTQTT